MSSRASSRAAECRPTFDIDALIDEDARPCRSPRLGVPPHTLLLLPEDGFGRDRRSSTTWVYGDAGEIVWRLHTTDEQDEGQTAAVAACAAEGLPAERTKGFDALVMKCTARHIGLRFPRNIPWADLPVLAAPRYVMGPEHAQPLTAWREDGGVRAAVDRRTVALEDHAATLRRVVLLLGKEDDPDQRVHQVRVMLDLLGATADIAITLVHPDGTIAQRTAGEVERIHARQARRDRAQYIYALNGRILFERVCNALCASHPYADDRGKGPAHDQPGRMAAQLASDPAVLQTLYALVRCADERGWAERTTFDSLRWLSEVADTLRAEAAFWRAAAADPAGVPRHRWSPPGMWSPGAVVPPCVPCGAEAGGADPVGHPGHPLTVGGALPGAAVLAQAALAHAARLEARIARVETRMAEAMAQEDSILAHAMVYEKTDDDRRDRIVRRNGWNYGAFRSGDAAAWVGSGTYPGRSLSEAPYRHSFPCDCRGDPGAILSGANLIATMWVKQTTGAKYTRDSMEIDDFRRGRTFHLPIVPTERGRALLALLPKECDDPDLLLRFEGIEDDDEAIRRMDRRLMKFFRELKRKVADYPASHSA